MSIPDYQSLMLPVLVACSKGEVRIGPVVDELANQLGLSPEERSELLPSGQQTVFSNRVHWAKSYFEPGAARGDYAPRILPNYAAGADGPRVFAPKD